jgi:hypothetical protein
MAKRKSTKGQTINKSHIKNYKTKDQVTRTPLKTGGTKKVNAIAFGMKQHCNMKI